MPTATLLDSRNLLKNESSQISKEQQPHDSKKEAQQWWAQEAGDTDRKPEESTVVRHISLSCLGENGQGAEQQHHIEGHEIRRGHCPKNPQGKADQRAPKQRRGKSLAVHKFAPETGKQLQEEGPAWPGARAIASRWRTPNRARAPAICPAMPGHTTKTARHFLRHLLAEPWYLPRKQRIGTILLGELGHSGTEWQSEAEGGETFCRLSVLQVVDLGRPQSCHSLPPPADDLYVAFYVTRKSKP